MADVANLKDPYFRSGYLRGTIEWAEQRLAEMPATATGSEMIIYVEGVRQRLVTVLGDVGKSELS